MPQVFPEPLGAARTLVPGQGHRHRCAIKIQRAGDRCAVLGAQTPLLVNVKGQSGLHEVSCAILHGRPCKESIAEKPDLSVRCSCAASALALGSVPGRALQEAPLPWPRLPTTWLLAPGFY